MHNVVLRCSVEQIWDNPKQGILISPLRLFSDPVSTSLLAFKFECIASKLFFMRKVAKIGEKHTAKYCKGLRILVYLKWKQRKYKTLDYLKINAKYWAANSLKKSSKSDFLSPNSLTPIWPLDASAGLPSCYTSRTSKNAGTATNSLNNVTEKVFINLPNNHQPS